MSSSNKGINGIFHFNFIAVNQYFEFKVLAMKAKNGNLHLEIQTPGKNSVGSVRSSLYGKVTEKGKQVQYARILRILLQFLSIILEKKSSFYTEFISILITSF